MCVRIETENGRKLPALYTCVQRTHKAEQGFMRCSTEVTHCITETHEGLRIAVYIFLDFQKYMRLIRQQLLKSYDAIIAINMAKKKSIHTATQFLFIKEWCDLNRCSVC